MDLTQFNSTSSGAESDPGMFQWNIEAAVRIDDNCTNDRLLQPIWSLALRYSYYTSSPLFPVVLSISLYFLCQVPCTILDCLARHWTSINKYRIQPEAEVSWFRLRPALITTAWNNLIYILPVSIAQWAWTAETFLPCSAPTVWEFCWKQYASLVIMDTEFFVWHVLHHRCRTLYRHVHSIHHQYHAVSSWTTQYVHPWELFSLGLMATTAPWIVQAHPLTIWSFMALVEACTVEEHSGYDLPLMPHRWVPFWGGSLKHDMHHQRPLTNFQPFFNWFDRLIGSEYPPKSKYQVVANRKQSIKKD